MNFKSNFSSISEMINKIKPWSKKITVLFASVCILFICIGLLTTIQPAYRLSSSTINEWTRQIDGASFLYLIQMENKSFQMAYPEENESIVLSDLAFQMATSIKPNDPRSLLGRELPGFETYDSKIIVAGEGTDYTNLPIESSAPLESVLKEREATGLPEEETNPPGDQQIEGQPTTGDKNVVFIYNTHNRESFLPHLPEDTTINQVWHSEVNITKVSDRLKKSLEVNGIGASVDHTDFGNVLNENGWEYWQSYNASRPIVETALANNKDFNYVFDLHRDSQRRDVTTLNIDGQDYARLAFVVGSDYNNDKNLKLATELHNKINEKYPKLSRTVITQGGSGNNGVYNQDLSPNSIVIEFGGIDNTMEELYRTADAFAEVFGDYYWDAEKVQGNP
ncbi:stage II sporulation protein P [Aquibacillus halophilus]|uniref:Stage II sporulation protein P n=1 Tax=Aquibacillus halophilus TaxID=930132 RepID=A0A6A8DJC5_9BACI|nr:stage II sporulation protein P [Aquibacillus halophilus]MRH43067.1 stage II sporulation protein P [Aquibacillus halophilus]